MRLYSQKDVDRKALRGARIAILGYGSQGRAHALNLRDSGYDVVVGVRKGDSWKKAKRDGLEVMEPTAAVQGAQLVAMLVPDLTQKALYNELKNVLEKGATLLFAHGFNIHFNQINDWHPTFNISKNIYASTFQFTSQFKFDSAHRESR